MSPPTKVVYVSERDAWLCKFDVDKFKTDVRAIGDELSRAQVNSSEELEHMNKLLLWSRSCTFIGIVTMGLGLNIISVIFLALGITTRWTILAHHSCHGGFDQVDKTGRHNRFQFGLGFMKRTSDWLDWMLTECWNVEHNQLHHYRLNEDADPDLVEKNLEDLREMNLPEPIKWVVVFLFAISWKYFYYAPNTYKELKAAQHNSALEVANSNIDATKKKPALEQSVRDAEFKKAHFTLSSVFSFQELPEWISRAELMLNVLLPYVFFQFILLPAPFLLVSSEVFLGALLNCIFADVLANIHSFLIVVTNHAGNDMYVYKTRTAPLSGEFYLRQVLSSADFSTGSDLVDFLQGFLNLQVEHHCFPSLSPLAYQIAHPRMKELCATHGVPFTQESVFRRFIKTVHIMTGRDSSRVFPEALEGFPRGVSVRVAPKDHPELIGQMSLLEE